MKKALYRILGALSVILMISLILTYVSEKQSGRHGYAVLSCVSDFPAVKAAKAAGKTILEENGPQTEDIRMQIVYQLARRSVVKVVVKDAAGSGIIWKVDDGIVVVSSRHLLMRDVEAEVTFCGGETAKAKALGYSQQYDIGFFQVAQEEVSDCILRNIYEAVPALYETETQSDRNRFADLYSDRQVLQIGAMLDEQVANCSVGTIRDLNFVPLFNTTVLETECFSRAGMSGGGVFDDNGKLLGMISGGDVPEGADRREAGLTYSIPCVLIAGEYEEIAGRQGGVSW